MTSRIESLGGSVGGSSTTTGNFLKKTKEQSIEFFSNLCQRDFKFYPIIIFICEILWMIQTIAFLLKFTFEWSDIENIFSWISVWVDPIDVVQDMITYYVFFTIFVTLTLCLLTMILLAFFSDGNETIFDLLFICFRLIRTLFFYPLCGIALSPLKCKYVDLSMEWVQFEHLEPTPICTDFPFFLFYVVAIFLSALIFSICLCDTFLLLDKFKSINYKTSCGDGRFLSLFYIVTILNVVCIKFHLEGYEAVFSTIVFVLYFGIYLSYPRITPYYSKCYTFIWGNFLSLVVTVQFINVVIHFTLSYWALFSVVSFFFFFLMMNLFLIIRYISIKVKHGRSTKNIDLDFCICSSSHDVSLVCHLNKKSKPVIASILKHKRFVKSRRICHMLTVLVLDDVGFASRVIKHADTLFGFCLPDTSLAMRVLKHKLSELQCASKELSAKSTRLLQKVSKYETKLRFLYQLAFTNIIDEKGGSLTWAGIYTTALTHHKYLFNAYQELMKTNPTEGIYRKYADFLLRYINDKGSAQLYFSEAQRLAIVERYAPRERTQSLGMGRDKFHDASGDGYSEKSVKADSVLSGFSENSVSSKSFHEPPRRRTNSGNISNYSEKSDLLSALEEGGEEEFTDEDVVSDEEDRNNQKFSQSVSSEEILVEEEEDKIEELVEQKREEDGEKDEYQSAFDTKKNELNKMRIMKERKMRKSTSHDGFSNYYAPSMASSGFFNKGETESKISRRKTQKRFLSSFCGCCIFLIFLLFSVSAIVTVFVMTLLMKSRFKEFDDSISRITDLLTLESDIGLYARKMQTSSYDSSRTPLLEERNNTFYRMKLAESCHEFLELVQESYTVMGEKEAREIWNSDVYFEELSQGEDHHDHSESEEKMKLSLFDSMLLFGECCEAMTLKTQETLSNRTEGGQIEDNSDFFTMLKNYEVVYKNTEKMSLQEIQMAEDYRNSSIIVLFCLPILMFICGLLFCCFYCMVDFEHRKEIKGLKLINKENALERFHNFRGGSSSAAATKEVKRKNEKRRDSPRNNPSEYSANPSVGFSGELTGSIGNLTARTSTDSSASEGFSGFLSTAAQIATCSLPCKFCICGIAFCIAFTCMIVLFSFLFLSSADEYVNNNRDLKFICDVKVLSRHLDYYLVEVLYHDDSIFEKDHLFAEFEEHYVEFTDLFKSIRSGNEELGLAGLDNTRMSSVKEVLYKPRCHAEENDHIYRRLECLSLARLFINYIESYDAILKVMKELEHNETEVETGDIDATSLEMLKSDMYKNILYIDSPSCEGCLINGTSIIINGKGLFHQRLDELLEVVKSSSNPNQDILYNGIYVLLIIILPLFLLFSCIVFRNIAVSTNDYLMMTRFILLLLPDKSLLERKIYDYLMGRMRRGNVLKFINKREKKLWGQMIQRSGYPMLVFNQALQIVHSNESMAELFGFQSKSNENDEKGGENNLLQYKSINNIMDVESVKSIKKWIRKMKNKRAPKTLHCELTGVTNIDRVRFRVLVDISSYHNHQYYFAVIENIETAKKKEILREAERQSESTEMLLSNILPSSIAAMIKNDFSSSSSFKKTKLDIVDYYKSITAMFADIVNFTPMMENSKPEMVVRTINGLFSGFDDLTSFYSIEKIKTIGDCYFSVCGLPLYKPNHALLMMKFCISILKWVEKFNEMYHQDIHLRIGCSSGAVVAGVIGKKKWCFDCWGKCINEASRMESDGVVDRIQVSRKTYEFVFDKFQFLGRTIDVQGLGVVKAYVLIPSKIAEIDEEIDESVSIVTKNSSSIIDHITPRIEKKTKKKEEEEEKEKEEKEKEDSDDDDDEKEADNNNNNNNNEEEEEEGEGEEDNDDEKEKEKVQEEKEKKDVEEVNKEIDEIFEVEKKEEDVLNENEEAGDDEEEEEGEGEEGDDNDEKHDVKIVLKNGNPDEFVVVDVDNENKEEKDTNSIRNIEVSGDFVSFIVKEEEKNNNNNNNEEMKEKEEVLLVDCEEDTDEEENKKKEEKKVIIIKKKKEEIIKIPEPPAFNEEEYRMNNNNKDESKKKSNRMSEISEDFSDEGQFKYATKIHPPRSMSEEVLHSIVKMTEKSVKQVEKKEENV